MGGAFRAERTVVVEDGVQEGLEARVAEAEVAEVDGDEREVEGDPGMQAEPDGEGDGVGGGEVVGQPAQRRREAGDVVAEVPEGAEQHRGLVAHLVSDECGRQVGAGCVV